MKPGAGEDAVVRRLARLAGKPGPGVVAGIGDDCAVVRPAAGGMLVLLKTDCVVEGRHFTPSHPATAVGWKSACRAVSDIAACGGVPRHALITCVLRAGQEGRWLNGVYRGLAKAAREFGFGIVGGDLSRTDGPAVINVALTGEVERERLAGRGGGRPGDVLFVTGRLGGSLASGRHLRFSPRLNEARWLTGNFPVNAMMDLSDGLASDLPRLAAASGTGFAIDPASVPRHRGASVAQALGDGEDYELVFAVPPRAEAAVRSAWARRFPRLALTRIGTLAAAGVASGLGGACGFDHFSS